MPRKGGEHRFKPSFYSFGSAIFSLLTWNLFGAVPYVSQPVYSDGRQWRPWLVSDQRGASGRPDVLAYVSEVLTAPVKLSGHPVANLVASTSGTDSDWSSS